MTKTCQWCSKTFTRETVASPSRFEEQKFCSRRCRMTFNSRKQCPHCGRPMALVSQQCRHCRPTAEWRRKVQWMIESRSFINPAGYRMIFLPLHPKSHNSYIAEHRVVAEYKIGRFTTEGEHVHHLNGDKLDNRPENLEVVTVADHMAIHKSGVTDAEISRLLDAGLTRDEIRSLGVWDKRIDRCIAYVALVQSSRASENAA